MTRILIILFLIGYTASLFAQNDKYLIIENPSDFMIYNKYQQKLKQTQIDAMTYFTPFRIINQNEILSDQITFASRCTFENEVYFIIKNDEGNYFTENPQSYNEIFSNCESIGDTIQIISGGQLSLKSRPKRNRSSLVLHKLNQDELWIRVFRYQTVYFLKSTDASSKFGWAELPNDGSWQIYIRKNIHPQAIPERIARRVETRIASANLSYKQYFTFFNQKFHVQKEIPQWQLDISENIIRGNLKRKEAIESLKISNRYLMEELENIILGSGLNITNTDMGFLIQAKKVK